MRVSDNKNGDFKITREKILCFLDTIFKTIDFYGPYKIINFFCATSFFDSKMLLTMSYAVFRQKIGDLKFTHEKNGVLDTISKTIDFYGPIQDHKTLCNFNS